MSLDQLEYQLKVLQEDQKKTQEKMWQILGAIKVVEYLISQVPMGTPVEPAKEGPNHG